MYPSNVDDTAFIDDDEIGVHDIFIGGLINRNRAIHGDTVGVELLPKSEWKALSEDDSEPRPSGKVVYINPQYGKGRWRQYLASLRSNRSAGALRQFEQRCGMSMFKGELYVDWANEGSLKAIPLDKRIPWMYIPKTEITKMCNHPERFNLKLDESSTGSLPEHGVYLARIVEWSEIANLPCGEIVRYAGDMQDVEFEEFYALHTHALESHADDFSVEIKAEANDVVLAAARSSASECSKRRDFTGEKIFTIDPVTARDLDDAVHIKRIVGDTSSSEPNHLEIGVHIADVSHFVTPDTAMSLLAAERATTIYLPHRAFHMLPRPLCEELCSLTPQASKHAFSCLFYLDYNGKLLADKAPQFFKSIIKSKYRLNYDEVQNLLDAEQKASCFPDEPKIDTHKQDIPIYLVPNADLSKHRFDAEEDPTYPLVDLSADLLLIHQLTEKIRNARFEDGSLLLNKVELRFECDEVTGLPLAVDSVKHSASHEMIEELMLMANKLVSELLVNSQLSEFAVIRYHPPVDERKADKLKLLLEKLGVPNKLSTAKEVHATLSGAYKKFGARWGVVIEQSLIECMRLARYGVYGDSSLGSIGHYALGFSSYTHFTSPIRRYADIMVHRLLNLVVDLDPNIGPEGIEKLIAENPWLDVEVIKQQCNICNAKKEAAKHAQESATRAWLMMHLKDREEAPVTAGTIIGIADKSLQVFVPELNFKSRIEFSVVKNSSRCHQRVPDEGHSRLTFPTSFEVTEAKTSATITWPAPIEAQNVKLFNMIPVVVYVSKDVPLDFVLLAACPNTPEFERVVQQELKLCPNDLDIQRTRKQLARPGASTAVQTDH